MARKLKQAIVSAPIKVEPLSPQAAIDLVLNDFRREITVFDERKEKFLADAKLNVSYAIEWADKLLSLDYTARILRNLISAYDEQKTTDSRENFVLLKGFVEHVRKDNRDSLLHDNLRGSSTSQSSNAVQHAHRAGAAHLEYVFESASYAIADAEKGLAERGQNV